MIHDLAATVTTPHINVSEPVGICIIVGLLVGYLAWRAGVSVIISLALLAEGALLAGVLPGLSGKLTSLAAAGAAEKSTTYIIAGIILGAALFTHERSMRRGGGGE